MVFDLNMCLKCAVSKQGKNYRVASSIIGGGNIHIFIFNRRIKIPWKQLFQKKRLHYYLYQYVYIASPQIIEFATLLDILIILFAQCCNAGTIYYYHVEHCY